MKTYKLLILGIGLFFISCTKCDCSEDWSADVLYKKRDVVRYNGICWKATGQGKEIVPGPWLENGNDIWVECED